MIFMAYIVHLSASSWLKCLCPELAFLEDHVTICGQGEAGKQREGGNPDDGG